jgi:hypothetical protein
VGEMQNLDVKAAGTFSYHSTSKDKEEEIVSNRIV